MKRLTFVLVLAIVGVCGLLLPNSAQAECTGMCPGGSFPCCCNGKLIGCATTVLECFDGCDETVAQSNLSSSDSLRLSELKAAIFAPAEQKDGIRELFLAGGNC